MSTVISKFITEIRKIISELEKDKRKLLERDKRKLLEIYIDVHECKLSNNSYKIIMRITWFINKSKFVEGVIYAIHDTIGQRKIFTENKIKKVFYGTSWKISEPFLCLDYSERQLKLPDSLFINYLDFYNFLEYNKINIYNFFRANLEEDYIVNFIF